MITLSPAAAEALEQIARDARGELSRIQAWWRSKSPDTQHGGFVGEVDAAGSPRPGADKAVVLYTRLLWFWSELASFGLDGASAMAQRAADYVSRQFLDARHGGLFWMLDANGRPVNRRKQAYAQAFGIYAFCAHYAATADKASLAHALALSDILEHHFLDRDGAGYWEARDEDFAPIADMRLSERDLNAPKSMNTHLHVLEAYTSLHRIRRTPQTGQALERAIRLMLDRIVSTETGQLRLFFDDHWRPLTQTVSFGHDIEASWLLWGAAEALQSPQLLTAARTTALRLADATLAEGVGPLGEVFEERSAEGVLAKRRVWWIQAEALVGFLNAFEITGEQRYLDASARVWRFIQTYQLDMDGEWRAHSTLDAPEVRADLQAGPWKCPYHTGRAMMEVQRRAASLLSGRSESTKQICGASGSTAVSPGGTNSTCSFIG